MPRSRLPFLMLLLPAFLLLKTGNAQSPARFSGQAVLEDLNYLYSSLQDTHRHLFAYTSQAAYDKHFAALRQQVPADSLDYRETVSLYQQLVSFANIGHGEIDFPVFAYITYVQEGGTIFPLELAFENGKAFIRKNFSANKEILPGMELAEIDHQPVITWVHKMFPLISAEREYLKLAKIEFLSFPRLLYQLGENKHSWVLKMKAGNGHYQEVTVQSVAALDYETARGEEILNPQRQLKFYQQTAYLNPGPFSGEDDVAEQQYEKYIDSVFVAIKNTGIRHLIIDLRNHPGGDNSYSDYLISCFASKPFRWNADFTLRTSAILKRETRKQKDTANNYSRAILQHADGEVYRYDLPAQQPKAVKQRFNGKVYVLVNRQTYSMAAVSAALIQDYGFGKIVGEETGDMPTLYASQFSFQLPRTKIVVKVPKGYIVRPNRSEKPEGVRPDIMLQDHLLDDTDEILPVLLRTLTKK